MNDLKVVIDAGHLEYILPNKIIRVVANVNL